MYRQTARQTETGHLRTVGVTEGRENVKVEKTAFFRFTVLWKNTNHAKLPVKYVPYACNRHFGTNLFT